MADVLGAGVQLAVGKSAGAALAELDVAGEIQFPGGPEPLHIGGTLLHFSPPLQQNGSGSGAGQHQRGKQTRRASAYHHRRQLRRGNGLRQLVGGTGRPSGDVLVPAAQHGGFVGHFGLHGVDHADAFPRVNAAAQNMQRQQCVFLNSQDMEYLGAEHGKPAAGGEFQIFDAQHGGTSCFDSCIVPQGRKKKNV